MLERWKTFKIPVIRNDSVQTPISEENHAYMFTQIMNYEQFAHYPPNANKYLKGAYIAHTLTIQTPADGAGWQYSPSCSQQCLVGLGPRCSPNPSSKGHLCSDTHIFDPFLTSSNFETIGDKYFITLAAVTS